MTQSGMTQSKPSAFTAQSHLDVTHSASSNFHPQKPAIAHEQVQFVPVAKIRRNAWNPNELTGELRSALEKDMLKNGLFAIDPILIRPTGDVYEIIDGESRWSIAARLHWKSIRAIIRQISEDEARTLCYRKNRERGTINPIKEAKLWQIETEKGFTQETIAKKYEVTQSVVSERLNLLRLAPPVQQMIIARAIKSSHAEIIARHPVAEDQIRIAEKTVDEDLSVNQLEDIMREELKSHTARSEQTEINVPVKIDQNLVEPDALRTPTWRQSLILRSSKVNDNDSSAVTVFFNMYLNDKKLIHPAVRPKQKTIFWFRYLQSKGYEKEMADFIDELVIEQLERNEFSICFANEPP